MIRMMLVLVCLAQGLMAQDIGYKQVGSGKEKVMVMHNWMGDCTSYNAMIPYLDTDSYTYVFADLRGYGRSKEIKGDYSVEEAAKDAIKLADSLQWEQFHLVGHSMSGMIIQKIASDHPARVKRMVAITPVPASGFPTSPDAMEFFESAGRDNDLVAGMCIDLMTGGRYTPIFAKKIVDELRASSTVEARLGYMRMFCTTNFAESVKGLETPILVLYGEHDFDGNLVLMQNTFMAWYPNAELECCKASGHYPMLETPVALVASIEKFLSSEE